MIDILPKPHLTVCGLSCTMSRSTKCTRFRKYGAGSFWTFRRLVRATWRRLFLQVVWRLARDSSVSRGAPGAIWAHNPRVIPWAVLGLVVTICDVA